MRSEPEIREALRRWVLAKATGLEPVELTDQTPLFEERHVRSVHLPELLLLLERLRGAPIDVEDLRPGDFRDIDTLLRRFGDARGLTA
ncbi:hypothetical protein [Mycobacterium riyadhense]|uniref:Acyl carrier protein n=1 Tax=Mycobacterium riyadhense TaxID=486698 RepID=A0A1X2CDU6_9MYCO|nr:hypothetical protein [Mycobacterium riyadhense]MCV7144627.1 hypothetical protein [Mycobacterium riyadhense]ORW74127.1 hypothetical protein AWC22_23700 [Mycobacterium riyadhense]VTP00385.1 hypothetical protein BIN_B_03487 [Mycobacterium riyadhense]